MATITLKTIDVSDRARRLLDAWLRGMQEGGHDVTADDIRTAYTVALRRAAEEAKRG